MVQDMKTEQLLQRNLLARLVTMFDTAFSDGRKGGEREGGGGKLGGVEDWEGREEEKNEEMISMDFSEQD